MSVQLSQADVIMQHLNIATCMDYIVLRTLCNNHTGRQAAGVNILQRLFTYLCILIVVEPMVHWAQQQLGQIEFESLFHALTNVFQDFSH